MRPRKSTSKSPFKFQKRKVIVHIDSLEKENKNLKEEIQELKAELDKVKHENQVLREANIRFQVELYEYKTDKENTIILEDSVSFSTSQDSKSTQDIIIEEKEKEGSCQDFGDYDEEENENSEKSNAKLYASQDQILARFKNTSLDQLTLDELNDYGPGEKNDSKFLNLIIPNVFDKRTLLNSSVTGKQYTNRNKPEEPSNKPPLDPEKLAFIRGRTFDLHILIALKLMSSLFLFAAMFIHRINKENESQAKKSDRIKKFHVLVGNKISNLKLSQRRRISQKVSQHERMNFNF